MLLQFASGIPFATGASSYLYQPVLSSENINRILVDVKIGSFEVQAYLDTGAVYMICAPEIGDALQLSETDNVGSERLLFRGTRYHGMLYRVPLMLLAEEGKPLEIDATTFIPQARPDQVWPREFRCILGMAGCFERLRFAIDPFEDTIYFGGPTADF